MENVGVNLCRIDVVRGIKEDTPLLVIIVR
jgi:hypothetical protein